MSRSFPFLLSVVVPCFDEEAVVAMTYRKLKETLAGRCEFSLEIIYVDDGSKDGTADALYELQAADDMVRVIGLSRNFGHQMAVSAGMDYATGDVIAIIDGDLQDPPEVILLMIDKWREGFDVVYGVRQNRTEGAAKRAAYALFYRLWRLLANIDIPVDSGDFCLLDRQVLDAIKALPESNRFVRGLRVGFESHAARANLRTRSMTEAA